MAFNRVVKSLNWCSGGCEHAAIDSERPSSSSQDSDRTCRRLPHNHLVMQLMRWELGQHSLRNWSRWDNCQGVKLHDVWQSHSQRITAVAISSDGNLVITASRDGTLAATSACTGNRMCQFSGHRVHVTCLVLTTDNRTVISGTIDGTIRLWRLPALNQDDVTQTSTRADRSDIAYCMHVVHPPHSRQIVRCMSLSGDGRLLAVGHRKGPIKLWKVVSETYDSASHVRIDGHHIIPPYNIFIRAIRDHVAAANAFGHEFGPYDILNASSNTTTFSTRSPQGANCGTATSVHSRREVDVWVDYQGHVSLPNATSIFSLVMTRDGKTLVGGDVEGTIRVWALPKGQLLNSIKAHNSVIVNLVLDHNEQTVFSSVPFGEVDYGVKAWNIFSGAAIPARHSSRTSQVVMSPDGAALVALDSDKLDADGLLIWDKAAFATSANTPPSVVVAHPAKTGTLLGGNLQTTSVVVGRAPQRSALARALYAMFSRQRPRRNALQFEMRRHIFLVAFSPDGSSIYAGGDDGLVYCWRPLR